MKEGDDREREREREKEKEKEKERGVIFNNFCVTPCPTFDFCGLI